MDKKLKILFLSDNFYPEVNAAASRVYERARYWVRWGHDVTVLTSAPNFPQGKIYPGYKNKWYQVETIQGIKVIRVKTFIHKNSGFFLRILDFLSYMLCSFVFGLFQKKPDVIVATSPQFFAAVSGWMLSAVKRVPFVFEVSDLWPASISAVGAVKHGFILQQLERLELFLYRKATAIVTLTQAFKKNMMDRGVPAEKITVIYNGADANFFKPVTKNQQLLTQLRLNHNFVVGYVGTLGMAHGLKNVIDSAIQLKAQPHIAFMFVGEGAEKSELVKHSKNYSLNNVTFVDQQPKEQVIHYWGLCDVALVHLRNDPLFATVFPSKIFEAITMGLPILLCSPKGEASDFVTQHDVGIWIPSEDPQALADSIHQLYESRERIKLMKDNALTLARQHTREMQAEKMLSVLSGTVF